MESTAHINHLANEMARLFKPGHDAVQTPEYETARKAYLRAEVVKMWKDVGYIPPPDHLIT